MRRKRGRPKGTSKGTSRKAILTKLHRKALNDVKQLKNEINSMFKKARSMM
jgi:hypothetical protein